MYGSIRTSSPYLQSGVAVGVVVGDVAHVATVFEDQREGGGVVGLPLDPTGRLGAADEVVSVVADVGSTALPHATAFHRLGNRIQQWLHSLNKIKNHNGNDFFLMYTHTLLGFICSYFFGK